VKREAHRACLLLTCAKIPFYIKIAHTSRLHSWFLPAALFFFNYIFN